MGVLVQISDQSHHCCDIIQVTENPEDGQENQDEEAMLNFIKNFGSIADVRTFMEGQMHLPPSMHDQFSCFRRALGTRFKQFGDLKTFQDQLAYFFDVFCEVKVIPASWVVFATSTAFLFFSTGKFVEETGKLFKHQDRLGHFCSMRAKYILMGLKDLVQMKQMKCSEDTQKAICFLASSIDAPVHEDASTDSEMMALVGALSGFDGDSWMRLRVDV